MTEVLDSQRAGVWEFVRAGADEGQVSTSCESEPVAVTVTAPSEPQDRVTAEWVEDLPLNLVRAYAERAWLHRRVREVDPGVWVASVVGLEGAYGDGGSPDEASSDLREAVVGWVAVRRRLGLEIPELEGLDLNAPGARPGPA